MNFHQRIAALSAKKRRLLDLRLGKLSGVDYSQPDALVERSRRASQESPHKRTGAEETTDGNGRLIAYLVPDKNGVLASAPDSLIGDVRSFLQGKLPSHMAPSSFVVLEALPLTPNGKVDRQSLPSPEDATSDRERNYIKPRTALERFLVNVWQEVLGLAHIGIQDNFFELGGDSIKGIVLINKVQERLGQQVHVVALLEAPRIADLAARIAAQYPEAEVLAGSYETGSPYEEIKVNQRATQYDRDCIVPRGAGTSLPLSSAQRRLWFLDKLEPNNAFYNVSSALRLRGLLDAPSLTRAINEVVRRHEILRTVFPEAEGQPVQVVATNLTLNLPLEDLRSLSPTEQEIQVRELALAEAAEPFNLTVGPLVRMQVLRLGEEDHVALLTMHHIISDGWSIRVLIRELGELYRAYSTKTPPTLPELPVQYADYALWQQRWLKSEAIEAQLAYWKQKLGGELLPLNLPTDRPRPPVQTFRGGRQSLVLAESLSGALQELSRRAGVTPFMTYLAGFKALLYRYTGQHDIAIGCPMANRNLPQTEALIGLFINTVVLRTNISTDQTFRELLGQVRQVTHEAFSNPDLPFEKLVEALQPERNLSRTPLFQVMFVQHSDPLPTLELAGLALAPLDVESRTAKFDLTMSVLETGPEVKLQLEYSTDLFDEATIARMLNHYRTLLEDVAANPDERLSNLQLLTRAEYQQAVSEWNGTRNVVPLERCLHELFEAQVERTPDSVAVIFEGLEITYADLNRKANQLAHYLRASGLRQEARVGILMQRSMEMMVALLAVLKAGCAYVPLDAGTQPKERLALMLEDAGIEILLIKDSLVNEVPEHAARVVRLDTEWNAIAAESGDNLPNFVIPNNLAYVIYTSGSTGKPKGVMIPHRGLVNYLTWCVESYEVAAGSGAAVHSPLGFDLTITSLFSPLLTGRSVTLLPERGGVEALTDVLQNESCFSLIKLTPAHLRALSHTLPAEAASGCAHRLIIGGEALREEDISFWRTHAPATALVNEYGPTEATIGCCVYEIAAQSKLPRGSSSGAVPIGRPIVNAQIYVLDPQLNPVPVGVTGELYIGGIGLARGYLNLPALTAEKFIPDPFSVEPGARLYQTGDLARYLTDGNIEFLGRLDTQVKVRGYRIEPGEVEEALKQHPAVLESLVVAHADASGHPRLLAYVVTPETESVTTTRLRDFLHVRLPDYMIPASFVMLESLPLTPNGKVDLRRLPAPDTARPALEETYAKPDTEAERKLADIWCEVLGLERVGVRDNFFELGGDSILSLQIIAKANRAGFRLAPKQIFQHQTVAELARAVDEAVSTEAEQGLVSGKVPLTPIQNWFFEQHLTDPHHWNQAVLLDLKRPLEFAVLADAVRLLLLHHDSLRLRFMKEDSHWRQFISPPGEPDPVEKIDLSNLSEEEQHATLESLTNEKQASLNLSLGPMLRVVLFDLGPQRPNRLLLTIHHLAVDSVSWHILLEDLQSLCEQLTREETVALPAKTNSFKQWSEKLTEHAAAELVQQELAYWLSQAQTEISSLPIDYPQHERRTTVSSARDVRVSLNTEETNALLHAVPHAYHTRINDVLLTAVAQAFASWTGARSLLLALEGHGREDLFDNMDLTRTVGWFTSICPVRLELDDNDTPGAALKKIKEQLRRVPHHGIGYGLLRYLSGKDEVAEKLRALPQPEVSFNYHGQFDRAFKRSTLFTPARESVGLSASLSATRPFLLEINGSVTGGRLQMVWSYSKEAHRHATIEKLAMGFAARLRILIAHCQAPDAADYSPSDFSAVTMSQQTLDKLLARVAHSTDVKSK